VLWVLLVVAMQGTGAECSSAPTPYDCAVAQVEHQQFPAAIDTLTRILASAPSNLKALNLLGIALTNAGRAEEASQRFEQALKLDPTFTPARKNLAINEFARGKLTESQRDFEQVLARVPDDEVSHLHLGEIAFQRKQVRAALPHYEKAHARIVQARNPAWLLHYSACLLDAPKSNSAPREEATVPAAPAAPTAAGAAGTAGAAHTASATNAASAASATAAVDTAAVSRAVALLDQLPSNDSASAFDAGVLLGHAEAYREAARFFAASRYGYKDPYAAGYNQVLMLVNAGDSTSATAAIRVADEMFARGDGMKRAELYSLVAQAYLKTERIKEAYDALREATRIEPTVVEHYVDLAMICVDHQNFELGLEIVAIGLKYRPESSLLYLQRGVLLAMKGAIEDAAAAFEQASKAAPKEPVPYVAQAMIWMQTGQAAKAVDVLRTQAQARMPKQAAPQKQASGGARAPTAADATANAGEKDAVIFYALGMALLRAGASPEDAAGTEAVNAFGTAVHLSPEFPQARAELGKLLMKRGDTDGAITHLEQAVALDPDNAAPAYVLAQAYRKRGDMDRARDLLARVSTINTRERGDDPEHELKRVIIRIVREGATPKGSGTEP
jgi:tetratricopeptide (TPR) repeat protein